jgi:NADH-quinone oxidoreductase subunit J
MSVRRDKQLGDPIPRGGGSRLTTAARVAVLMLAVSTATGHGAQATAGPTTNASAPTVTRVEAGGTLEAVIFYSFAGVALLSALGVVLSQNIVRTAVCLFFTLGAMAGFYFLLAANFVGAVQLIVYAGGTLVLIIFGVMLTGRSMVAHFRPRWFEVLAGTTACGLLLVGLVAVLCREPWAGSDRPMTVAPTIEAVGVRLLTDYLVPFEVVSVLLLVAMIGAAYLARPERR